MRGIWVVNREFEAFVGGGGQSGFTKEGTGTLTLTNANTFTGLTRVNEGEVVLNAGIGNEAISRNIIIGDNVGGDGGGDFIIDGGTVTLNNTSVSNQTIQSGTIRLNGGTLLLGTDNQINNGTNMVLSGGTFNVNGYSETLGTLTLNADSVIDFGDIDRATDAILTFADSSGETWDPDATLTVTNWRGTVIYGDGGDQLVFGTVFGTLTQQQLSQIYFEGYGPLVQLPDGEVVPVPEPRVYAALGLLGFAAWRERKRLCTWARRFRS